MAAPRGVELDEPGFGGVKLVGGAVDDLSVEGGDCKEGWLGVTGD